MATVPLGRGSTASDVANACCYLASDEANFITGVNLEVSSLYRRPFLQLSSIHKFLTLVLQVDGGRCV